MTPSPIKKREKVNLIKDSKKSFLNEVSGESQQESARARVEWNLAHGGGPGAKPKEGERKKRGGAKKGDAKKGEGKKEEENQGNRGSDKVRPLDRGSFAITANDKRYGAKSRFGRRFPCWA